MTTFLALYRGHTTNDAQVIAVSTDTDLVALVAEKLLASSEDEPGADVDPATNAIQQGRRKALTFITRGAA